MRRYRRAPKEDTTTRRAREQAERERIELRELALREVRNAINLALRDAEKELAKSLRNIDSTQSGRLIFRSPGTAGTPTSGSAGGGTNWGAFLGSAVGRLFASQQRQRTRSSQTDAIETGRSEQENQFYRESRSQREASISQLSGSGTRNL